MALARGHRRAPDAVGHRDHECRGGPWRRRSLRRARHCGHELPGGQRSQGGRRRREGEPQGLAGRDGALWIAETASARTYDGTDDNDELLSHHASDTINGGAGKDIIWGDWDPNSNPTDQRDRLNGDAGADWIYTSHGTNTVRGGAGNDFIYAYYGHGTIDCGRAATTA